jgi:hypothetical protein
LKRHKIAADEKQKYGDYTNENKTQCSKQVYKAQRRDRREYNQYGKYKHPNWVIPQLQATLPAPMFES